MAIPNGVQVGDVVVSLAQVVNNLGEEFKAGTEFAVHEIDGDDYLALEPVTEVIPGEECGIWFYFYETHGEVDNTGLFVIKQ